MKLIKYTLLILLSLTLTSCTFYKDVEMRGVQNYKIGEVKDGKIDVIITVKISNPNRYKIKIKKTALDMFVDDKSIGQAVMKKDVTIEKKIEKDYDFVIQADYDQIKKSAGMIMSAALFKKTLNVKAKGKVRAVVRGIFSKKMDVDVNKEVNLSELIDGF